MSAECEARGGATNDDDARPGREFETEREWTRLLREILSELRRGTDHILDEAAEAAQSAVEDTVRCLIGEEIDREIEEIEEKIDPNAADHARRCAEEARSLAEELRSLVEEARQGGAAMEALPGRVAKRLRGSPRARRWSAARRNL